MIGVAFLAGFLIVCNLVMWFVLLAKFNAWFSARYSTDDVVEAVKTQIDQIVKDMDRNTERDITLVHDRLRQLKELIAKADRQLAVLRNELEKQAQAKQGVPQGAPSARTRGVSRSPRATASRAADQYRQNMAATEAYAVTTEGKRQLGVQGDLFDADGADLVAPSFQEPNTFTVERDGTAYTAVPVVAQSVAFSDEPVVPKEDFSMQVRKRYDRGDSVEEIAAALGRSSTEVQIALDMGA